MNLIKISWSIWAVIAAASLYALSIAPVGMMLPIHWNIYGESDGQMEAKIVLVLMPAIMLGVLLLLVLLKYIEPRQENLEKSNTGRQWTILAITLFLGVLALNNVAMIMGIELLSYRGMLSGAMLLLVVIGNFLPKIRSNFFIGIRTPWTLSSEDNWKKTHKLSGKIFVVFGLLGLLVTILLPDKIILGVLFVVVLVPILIVPVAYSWHLWRSEQD